MPLVKKKKRKKKKKVWDLNAVLSIVYFGFVTT